LSKGSRWCCGQADYAFAGLARRFAEIDADGSGPSMTAASMQQPSSRGLSSRLRDRTFQNMEEGVCWRTPPRCGEHLREVVLAANADGLDLLRRGHRVMAFEQLKYAESVLVSNPDISAVDNDLLGMTCSNLGCYYRKAGLPRAALLYLTRALRAEEASAHETPVQDVCSLATTKLNTCAALSGVGRHEEAEKLAVEAVELLSPPDGGTPSQEECTMIAVACHNLGAEREHLGRWAYAAVAYRQGTEVARKTLGPKNALTRTLTDRCSHVLAKAERNPHFPCRPVGPRPHTSRSRPRTGASLTTPRGRSGGVPFGDGGCTTASGTPADIQLTPHASTIQAAISGSFPAPALVGASCAWAAAEELLPSGGNATTREEGDTSTEECSQQTSTVLAPQRSNSRVTEEDQDAQDDTFGGDRQEHFLPELSDGPPTVRRGKSNESPSTPKTLRHQAALTGSPGSRRWSTNDSRQHRQQQLTQLRHGSMTSTHTVRQQADSGCAALGALPESDVTGWDSSKSAMPRLSDPLIGSLTRTGATLNPVSGNARGRSASTLSRPTAQY